MELDNLTEVSSEMHTIPNKDTKYKVLVTKYKGEGNKTLWINQADDTGKPEQVLARAEKIKINDIDAWVLDNKSKNAFIQIMFWRDGKYFNVNGIGIGRDKLIEIGCNFR